MGRGSDLKQEDVQLVNAAYQLAKQKLGGGAAIGAGKISKSLPAHLKRTTVNKVLAALKAGVPTEDIAKKRTRAKTVVREDIIAKVGKLLATDNSSEENSHRQMARKLKISKASVQKIVKTHLEMKPLKHVKTTKNQEATLAARQKQAEKIVKMLDDGLAVESIWFSDETWVEGDSNGKFNPQNDRKYHPNSAKKDEVMDDLLAPKVQRPIGVMVHLTCSARNNGVLLKPHVIPFGQTITSEYYGNMLESDVFRQIETHMGDDEWVFRQDMASARTSKASKQRIDQGGATLLPWPPAGADLTPPEIYVNPKLKNCSTRQKLKRETVSALREMRSTKILAKIKKTRLSFPEGVR